MHIVSLWATIVAATVAPHLSGPAYAADRMTPRDIHGTKGYENSIRNDLYGKVPSTYQAPTLTLVSTNTPPRSGRNNAADQCKPRCP
jgi:hypothetical protein